jgi:hypothetical protein
MNNAARNLRRYHHPDADIPLNAFMGGYHFVTTLDFMQHGPVGGLPLYTYADPNRISLLALTSGTDTVKHREVCL